MEINRLTDKTIEGKNIYLRLLTLKDVSSKYLKWMQDKEVYKFLVKREENVTFSGLRRYVKSILKSKNNYFFGVFTRNNDKHIGNIKIGGIHNVHKFADLGILIGDKKEWGKGYGTEAIMLATKYAFKVLHLHKLFAGINQLNTSSYKAFINARYKEAGRLKEHIFYNNKYVDSIIVERINKE